MNMIPDDHIFEPTAQAGWKYVPEGEQHERLGKIPANYYCRGWNSKRLKYCGARAGQGTDHPGEGRCLNHGGSAEVTHGRYRSLKSKRVKELFDEHSRDPDPMDVFPELHMMRALVQDWIERFEANQEALLAWHHSFSHEYQAQVDADREAWIDEGNPEEDFQPPSPRPSRPKQVLDISDSRSLLGEVVRTVTRIEKLQNVGAVSRSELLLLVQEMGRVVERSNTIEEPVKRLEAIKDGWLAINTRAGIGA